MGRTRPPYPAEFRQQIIELARAGRTPAQDGALTLLSYRSDTSSKNVIVSIRSGGLIPHYLQQFEDLIIDDGLGRVG